MHTNMGNVLTKLSYVSYITKEQQKVFTNFVAVPNRYTPDEVEAEKYHCPRNRLKEG